MTSHVATSLEKSALPCGLSKRITLMIPKRVTQSFKITTIAQKNRIFTDVCTH